MPRQKKYKPTKKIPMSIKRRMIPFTLWLVRHGETFENRNNIYQGQTDTRLSDVGVKQAQLVARRLQGIQFSHVFSSDLQRAWKTAQTVLDANQYNAGLDIVKDQRLREKRYGIFETKSHSEVKEFLKTIPDAKQYIPEGGETEQQLYTRVINFFDELCRKIARSQQRKPKAQPQRSDGEENLSESVESDSYVAETSGKITTPTL